MPGGWIWSSHPREPCIWRRSGFPSSSDDRSKQDMTDRMVQWARNVSSIWKKRPLRLHFQEWFPEQRYGRIKVYNEKGMPVKKEWDCLPRYLWTIFLCSRRRWRTPSWSRTSWEFLERIFTLKDAGGLGEKRKSWKCSDFHTRHKL